MSIRKTRETTAERRADFWTDNTLVRSERIGIDRIGFRRGSNAGSERSNIVLLKL